MRKLLAAIAMCFAAIGAALAPAPPCDVAKAIDEVTVDPEMRAYLATVPVVFVDGQPICEGHEHPGDETRGCFFALPTPHIEIATMTFNGRAIGAWLFEDEMRAALIHELRHAIQWHKCGILAEPIGTTWTCVP